jgi:hypothetical protein
METKKIIKNIAIGLICLLLPVLIALNIYQYQQNKKLSDNTTSEASVNNSSTTNAIVAKDNTLQKATARRTTLVTRGKAAGNNEADEINYQLDAAEEELDTVNGQLSKEEAKKAELKKAELELHKKAMKDPSMKKNMKTSLDFQYGDLFKKLNLSPEKLEKFKDLLVDEMIAQQNIYLESEADATTLSKEKQAEMSQRYQALNKEYEAKKIQLLGQNGYEECETYMERIGERFNVNGFMESITSGEKVTEAQKEELINAMYEERKDVKFIISDADTAESSNMYDEKSIARMLDFQDRQGEAYIKAAKGILSASQVEQFKAYLKRQRDIAESSIKLEALRVGSQTTQKSDDKKSK